MNYVINRERGVLKLVEEGQTSFIPEDPENADYQKFLKWIQKGGKPTYEKDVVVDLPVIITRQQGLLWMFTNLTVMEDKILENINKITDVGERYKATIALQSNRWHSDDPYVQMMGISLGLDTPEKLKQAFEGAKQL